VTLDLAEGRRTDGGRADGGRADGGRATFAPFPPRELENRSSTSETSGVLTGIPVMLGISHGFFATLDCDRDPVLRRELSGFVSLAL